jgi:hypothetical protein
MFFKSFLTFSLLYLTIFSAIHLYSQDKIVKENGDTLKCRILSINSENIDIEVKLKNRVLSSYIPLDQVKSYSFELIERLGEEYDTTAIYDIEFNEGSEIYARIKDMGTDELILESDALGNISVKVYNIKKISSEKFSIDKKGKYWFPNPNTTRYFFAPSAINLEKGSGYYQNVYVLLNMFNYGITNWFSIGGGFEFITTFSSLTGGGSPIAFITPKVGFPVGEKVHLGAGFLGGFFAEETAGMFYGLGTYGSHDKNLSLGLGWGFVEGEFQENPFITVSGMLRTGRKFSLVTENWFIPTEGYYAVISYGGRFFGPKMSIDVGFLNNLDIIEFLPIGIPYVDFVLKF